MVGKNGQSAGRSGRYADSATQLPESARLASTKKSRCVGQAAGACITGAARRPDAELIPREAAAQSAMADPVTQ
jgi:hypothetical protein